MTTELNIVCVYKTGGDFDGEYIEYLYTHLQKYADEYTFVCLTDADDVPDDIPQWPLRQNWPSWWSKMEMFNPERIEGDILYFDLDTVFRDDIDEMVYDACDSDTMIMLTDFYFPENLASGIMYIPYEVKHIFWNEFKADPEGNMQKFRGDQNFLEHVIQKYGLTVERWDDLLPDYIASYKTHIVKQYPKHLKPLQVDVSKSKIICYHGKPRPKATDWASV